MHHSDKTRLWAVAVGLAIAGAMMAPFGALAIEDKLVVVTSYPPDTTETVKKAFENK